jgi:hypothetical protein
VALVLYLFQRCIIDHIGMRGIDLREMLKPGNSDKRRCKSVLFPTPDGPDSTIVQYKRANDIRHSKGGYHYIKGMKECNSWDQL